MSRGRGSSLIEQDLGGSLQRTAAFRKIVRSRRFDSIAVHGIYGMQEALQNQGAIMEPVYASAAQHFASCDELEAAEYFIAPARPAWAYSRIANPTTFYLESTLGLLESYGFDGEVSACVTASGMSAIHMATHPFLDVAAGSCMNIVASAKCYGGTFMLFSVRYGKERGVDVRWIRDPLDLDAWQSAIDENTRFLYTETPSNPSVSISDVAALARLAHEAGLPLIVDSTLATPALQRPLLLGADIVVHSISKCLGATGTTIGGVLIGRLDIPSRVGLQEMRDDFGLYVKVLPARDHGPSLSPMAAFTVLNDVRTLRARIDQMSRTALTVAKHLDDHPSVDRVWYPGLASHPGHAVAAQQMRLVDAEAADPVPERFGHLLGFEVSGGPAAAHRVYDALKMIYRAPDLGRVKSIATIPAVATHLRLGDAGLQLAEVPANLIRLSVGCEHPADIIEDIDRALDEGLLYQRRYSPPAQSRGAREAPLLGPARIAGYLRPWGASGREHAGHDRR